MRPGLYSQSSLCMCVQTSAHPTSLLDTPPNSSTAAGGDASRQRAPEKQQHTSKEFQWWNMIINLYPMSLRVLPSPKHHLLAWGGNGEERMIC